MFGKNKEKLTEELNQIQNQILAIRGDISFFENKKKDIISETLSLEEELNKKKLSLKDDELMLEKFNSTKITDLNNELNSYISIYNEKKVSLEKEIKEIESIKLAKLDDLDKLFNNLEEKKLELSKLMNEYKKVDSDVESKKKEITLLDNKILNLQEKINESLDLEQTINAQGITIELNNRIISKQEADITDKQIQLEVLEKSLKSLIYDVDRQKEFTDSKIDELKSSHSVTGSFGEEVKNLVPLLI